MLRKNKVFKLITYVVSDDLTKAKHFNDFFINVTESLTTKLNSLDKSTLSTFVTRITPTKDCTDLNWELVKSNIQRAINPKKATGSDFVSPRDLFLVSPDLVTHSLPPLYKNSLITASFPCGWTLFVLLLFSRKAINVT